MSFTYTPGGTTYIDRIRFLLQDTIEPAELQDEELDLLYSSLDSETFNEDARVMQAAFAGAKALLTRYARLVSFSADGTNMQYTQRAQFWKSIVVDLSDSVQPWIQIIRAKRPDDSWVDYQEDALPIGKRLLQ